jgi:hypothetical protein
MAAIPPNTILPAVHNTANARAAQENEVADSAPEDIHQVLEDVQGVD